MTVMILLTKTSFSQASLKSQVSLEQGVALTKVETLKALEAKGFSLGSLISPVQNTTLLSNLELSKLETFQPIINSLKQEMKSLAFNGGARFDLKYLENPNARFILVGVINRADRGYATGNYCGEIRFIYRLAYRVMDHGKPVSSRLPMTINLIFHGGTQTDSTHCAKLAEAWLKMESTSKSEDWINKGPLHSDFFTAKNLKALEINLQAERQGAGAKGSFGGNALYLLKVYDWIKDHFQEATLENQIDREALIKNKSLLNELKSWLLDVRRSKEINDGTLIIPTKFLAKKAITVAPGGIARSINRPFYDLITEEEIKTSLFQEMDQVKSPAAFLRRLNDSTCTGCHQTRAIGGFHFTGIDPAGKYPGNSVFLPGSPHFLGDLSRRKSLLQDIGAKNPTIDFSRGFSARPQERKGSASLQGTGLLNGWGAHCSNSNDPSFKSWRCSTGFICKQLLDYSDNTQMGICIHPTQKVGDPCEFGISSNKGFGQDQFRRTNNRKVELPNAMCSPQSQDPGTKTGGFLNGNIRLLSCQDGPGESGLPPEAVCGPLPASRPGFNNCIGKKNFDDCLKEFSMGVGLRGCDQKTPCRDDYICAESFTPERGVCVPPYFLFQFRVDGHPKGDKI